MNKYKVGEIVSIAISTNLQKLGCLPAQVNGKIIGFIEQNVVSVKSAELAGIAIAGLDTFVCGKCATKLQKKEDNRMEKDNFDKIARPHLDKLITLLVKNLDTMKLHNLQFDEDWNQLSDELAQMLSEGEMVGLIHTIFARCQR